MKLGSKITLAGPLLFALTIVDASVDGRQDIWLEIPPIHAVVEANSVGTIPDSDLSSLRIVIAHQPDQVNYGSILAKINTESANIVMSAKSTADGILCDFDLTRRGGFRLHPGRNSVEISFFDSSHRLRYASFILDAPSTEVDNGVLRATQPDPQHGKKYAVIVGISKYRNNGPGLPNLRFADRDAKSFYDLLVSPEGGGVSPEDVRLLLNGDATLKNLRDTLSGFLARAHENDIVFFFFAGHGGADRDDDGVAEGKPNLYLGTSDVDPGNIKGTALSVLELQRLLEESAKSRNFVTFADPCRVLWMHAAREKSSMQQNNLINQYVERFAGAGDRAVITASDISQTSQESEQWDGGHGVFTYFLLRGMRGEADLNNDGVVTVAELFAYIRDHVYKETGGTQRPIMRTGLSANLNVRSAPVHSLNQIRNEPTRLTVALQHVGR